MTFGLNLLPRGTKREVALEEVYERWRGGLMTLIFLLIVLAAGIFGLHAMLKSYDQDLQGELQQLQIRMNQQGALDISQATIEVNEKILLLSSALQSSHTWSAALRPIIADIPNGVEVSHLEITAQGKVTLKGTAATRASFLSLQAAMTNSKALINATTTDTASKREDLPFTYTATLPPSS